MNLVELLITIFVLTTVLLTASSAYIAGQRAWQKGIELNELVQNTRIAIEKISRELRQTNEIITILPNSSIEFQDGHSENLQYLQYYLDNNLLKRKTIVYELSGIPVRWDIQGAIPVVQQDITIAEQITNLEFSGNQLITININNFSTKVAGRNIK